MTATSEKTSLLTVARYSIEHGLYHNTRWSPTIDDHPKSWRAEAACFVTLHRVGYLRGCIGTIEAIEPLVINVARNAYGAAFNDPRFPALTPEEWPEVELSLSLLTPAEPLNFANEAELLGTLQPGRDGLIIEKDHRRATFLPSVWESLEEPQDFLTALKRKAGMAADVTPARAWRYQCEIVSEDNDA